jgi:opacity protein-like surface antigen
MVLKMNTMKKLLAIIGLGLSLGASAQIINETGIVAGPNLHYTLKQPDYVEYNAGTGYSVGFSNNLQLSPHSSVYLGAMYEKRNFSFKNFTNNDIGPIVSPTNINYTNTFITIPLLYRYTFGSGSIQPFATAGLQADFGYKQKTAFEYEDDIVQPFEIVSEDKEFHLSAAVGAGVKFKVNSRVSLSAEYRQSFIMHSTIKEEISGSRYTVSVGDDDYTPFTTSYLLLGVAVKVGKN